MAEQRLTAQVWPDGEPEIAVRAELLALFPTSLVSRDDARHFTDRLHERGWAIVPEPVERELRPGDSTAMREGEHITFAPSYDPLAFSEASAEALANYDRIVRENTTAAPIPTECPKCGRERMESWGTDEQWLESIQFCRAPRVHR